MSIQRYYFRSLGVIFYLACTLAISAQDPPNIVLIFTDDQGWNDVGCYGSEIPTPHIDRLAREGMKFEQCYAASAICTPSRFGLLTGRNPSRSHDQLLSALMFMGDEDLGIRPTETTIAALLREHADYETALIGKWHLGHGQREFLPNNHGFDFFRGHTGGCIDYFTMTYGKIPDWYHNFEHVHQDGYATELITREAVEYLKDKRDSDRPFFLYLPYNAPHFGKGYSPADDAPVNIMQPQAKDLLRVSHIKDKVRREFAAMTVNLDDGIGAILAALDETGLAGNTLVLFITDHGGDPVYGGSNIPLRGRKATLFEGGIRVPALVRWPRKIEAGVTSDQVVSTLDLFPTLSAIAGVSTQVEKLDGIDISPMIFSGKELPHRILFWELGAHAELGRAPWEALRSGDWKYVRDADGQQYLFNLRLDPNERTNVKDQKSRRLTELQGLWNTLAREYHE
ncbi:MAG: sulfatase-like hydrolase/transferase [Saprospiraceae bacterium]|nr:sulfatase-like hydrolase/transferase [Saprospiraceae bacterium]